jgi:hypothetical protein
MKKLFFVTIAVMFISLFAEAQTSDPELDYIKKAYSKDKKTIVDQYMGLDVQEGGKFWPLYGDYEASREKLAHERFTILTQYVNSLDQLTPELADKLAKSILTNNINLEKLNLDNYEKMKKAIGAIKAAKYLQLETYLQTSWRALVQDNIPLIGDLDKTKQK